MDPVMADDQAFAAADARARTTYDVSHERPWGWKVSAYLWTKSISAGVFLLAAMAIGFGFVKGHWLYETAAAPVSLIFLAATVGLLVWDLKRPERFLSILLRPQWKSWLVIGGYILVIFGAMLMAWMMIPFVGLLCRRRSGDVVRSAVRAMSAIYSAFLFKQARGRVFWHSTLTPLHLLVQSMVAGAAVLMLVMRRRLDHHRKQSWQDPAWSFLYYEFIGALVANGVLIAGELFMPEDNVERKRAVRLITRGIFRNLFWGGAVIIGLILPLLALTSGAAEYQIARCADLVVGARGLVPVGAHLGTSRASRPAKLDFQVLINSRRNSVRHTFPSQPQDRFNAAVDACLPLPAWRR